MDSAEPDEAADPTPTPDAPSVEPSFRGWMGSMWLYTTLRFGLFGALWGILYVAGVSGYLAALIGLVVSVPLSFVLLAKPRARFAAQIEARVDSRRFQREDLDTQLDPDAHDREAELREAELLEAELREAEAGHARRVDLRKKSRRAATSD